jgi:hypothetical protein
MNIIIACPTRYEHDSPSGEDMLITVFARSQDKLPQGIAIGTPILLRNVKVGYP